MPGPTSPRSPYAMPYGMLLRLAARNVWRNSRRTLLSASAIAVCASAIIVGRSLLNGVSTAIIEAPTRSMVGHAQIHEPSYLNASAALPLQKNLEWDDRLYTLLRQDPEVVEAAGRIHFSALLTDPTQERNALCLGVALEPRREKAITTKVFEEIAQGQPLSEDDPDGIVVAQAIANVLGLKVGDEVSILTTTEAGSMTGRDVHVRGISQVPLIGIATKSVYMVLPTAQRLLRMEGKVTEVGVALEHPEPPQAEAYVVRVQEVLKAAGYVLQPRPWMEAAAAYMNTLALWESVFSVLVSCFYAAMVSGIANTMLMNVTERITEIGTMMALGVRRAVIVRLFLLEALLLGVLGATGGAVLSLVLVAYLGRSGINVGLAGDLPDIVYPWIEPHYPLLVITIAMFVTVVAALWPVHRVSRLTPVEALSG